MQKNGQQGDTRLGATARRARWVSQSTQPVLR